MGYKYVISTIQFPKFKKAVRPQKDMITDKIKFAPGFAKADSKTFASAGVEVKGIEPERIWRNVTNITNWPRFNNAIVDINYEDSADTDPHLYDKAQFYYDLANGNRVRCQVVCFTHPKDDRVGRLAIRGTVFDGDGKEINEKVTEVIVGVPDSDKREILNVEVAESFKEEEADAAEKNHGDALKGMLEKLIDWSIKHK